LVKKLVRKTSNVKIKPRMSAGLYFYVSRNLFQLYAFASQQFVVNFTCGKILHHVQEQLHFHIVLKILFFEILKAYF